MLYSYALAVIEENACGGTIVTAPTSGSCGILPAILYEHNHDMKFSEQRILRALVTAGLFGNVVKHNASISGAEVGCQGEIGVACAMAAAAARAADATFYAISSDGNHRISFDHVVEVMKRTGHDLPSLYKETSEGGLALEYT